ncbi:ATP-dependent Clp protease proteolytic subunit 1 [Thalassoglobus neptunius]|uniref:ATP-dependent Clp protease proteolytic subunit n=1 Tax=Thalassoglobus neptunius TaxID=1938619 RepID=A0A5C5WM02_9PLAN|nr:head maturation protease, ClpP-related [Thalassoglobus neptunius]TWT51834.1 ATP-dependent Clp protease proteolytic subunit 1 [Thalassoglobus neptunius]
MFDIQLNSIPEAQAAEVLIYDRLGSGPDQISAKAFREQLESLGEVSEIRVRIHSAGGSIPEGLAIYNTLKEFGNRIPVDVFIDGVAASMASVIAMAGRTITMPASAQMMIHKPSFPQVSGGAQALRKHADDLDKWDSDLLDIYSSRSRLGREEISQMMDKETWMNGVQAFHWGFATHTTQTEVLAPVASLDNFKNVPENLKQVSGANEKDDTLTVQAETNTPEPTSEILKARAEVYGAENAVAWIGLTEAECQSKWIEAQAESVKQAQAESEELRKTVKELQAKIDEMEATAQALQLGAAEGVSTQGPPKIDGPKTLKDLVKIG